MAIDLTNKQRELLALVERLGSAESRAIAEVLGVTQERAAYSLRILRKRGLVVCSHNGRGGRWSTPANSAHAVAAHEAAYRLEVEQERARKRLAQQAYRASAFERWATCITRRVVPAASCPPIRPPAPASVFNLARCA
jgi:predicted transcriptional regulator